MQARRQLRYVSDITVLLRDTVMKVAAATDPLIRAEVWSSGAAKLLALEGADDTEIRLASAFLESAGSEYGNAHITNLPRRFRGHGLMLLRVDGIEDAQQLVGQLRHEILYDDLPLRIIPNEFGGERGPAAEDIRAELRSVREFVENGHILRDKDAKR